MKTKNAITLLLLISIMGSVFSQPAFDATYTVNTTPAPSGSSIYLTKLGIGGYKYVLDDKATKTIKIYNTNNSLLTTITVPTVVTSGAALYNISYISDDLFDLTNDIEYVVHAAGNSTVFAKVYVFKENGTQVFFKDSAMMAPSFPTDLYNSAIFYNGTSVKMKLQRYTSLTGQANISRWDLYTLPGSLPCFPCAQQPTMVVTANKAELPGTAINDPVFYPNPASDQVKLKYDLPDKYKTALIKIQDVQGKLIEEFKVDNTFDFIYIPATYNSGLYFYSLIIDGKVIKTEKIIINK